MNIYMYSLKKNNTTKAIRYAKLNTIHSLVKIKICFSTQNKRDNYSLQIKDAMYALSNELTLWDPCLIFHLKLASPVTTLVSLSKT